MAWTGSRPVDRDLRLWLFCAPRLIRYGFILSLTVRIHDLADLLRRLPFPLAVSLLVIIALQLWHLLVRILVIVLFAFSAHTLHTRHVTTRTSSATEFGEVDAAEAAIFTHAAAELVEVIVFGCLILFVLVDPLQKG
jgi:hypothetical protein